jgi:hypothetical protein
MRRLLPSKARALRRSHQLGAMGTDVQALCVFNCQGNDK